jgi:hypothetical protein
MISIKELASKSYEDMTDLEKDFLFMMAHSEYKEYLSYKSGIKDWFKKLDDKDKSIKSN